MPAALTTAMALQARLFDANSSLVCVLVRTLLANRGADGAISTILSSASFIISVGSGCADHCKGAASWVIGGVQPAQCPCVRDAGGQPSVAVGTGHSSRSLMRERRPAAYTGGGGDAATHMPFMHVSLPSLQQLLLPHWVLP